MVGEGGVLTSSLFMTALKLVPEATKRAMKMGSAAAPVCVRQYIKKGEKKIQKTILITQFRIRRKIEKKRN